MIHRGHLDLLRRAKKLGDWLIVGINSDAAVRRLKGHGRPVNNQDDREFMLRSLWLVDDVMIIDADTVADAIREVKPAVWIKGGDWTLETLNKDEVAAANEVGARIEILKALDGYSSTSVIERMQA